MYKTAINTSYKERNLIESFKNNARTQYNNTDVVNFRRYHKYQIKGFEFGGKNAWFNNLNQRSCFEKNDTYTVYEFLTKYQKPHEFEHNNASIFYAVNERTEDIISGILKVPTDIKDIYFEIRGTFRTNGSRLYKTKHALHMKYVYRYNFSFDCRRSRRESFDSEKKKR